MVNGVFTIPLVGRRGDPKNGPEGAAEFIAGPENRLAAHALRSYLEPVVTPYSPLVLYGPRGTGKSHLVDGLIAYWAEHFPKRAASCFGGLEFAREHSAAISEDRLDEWRRELQGVSLFVLDDVSRLATKSRAQRELVRLLDTLADHDALVVVTDRSLPTHCSHLLPALRGRLSAGLVVPVSLPAAETRRVILERLAAARGLALSKRALQSLADSLPAGVPALIRVLLELDLHSQLNGQPIDASHVRQFVAACARANAPSLRDVAMAAAKHFGLTLADLKSPSRRQPLVRARGVAMYLARQLTGKSFDEIGAYFGGRDHTTVLYGCRRTEGLLARDPATRQTVAELKRQLNAF